MTWTQNTLKVAALSRISVQTFLCKSESINKYLENKYKGKKHPGNSLPYDDMCAF